MPFADYEDFDACVRDNSDKDDPKAYCAEIKRQVEGAELSDAERQALEESECPEGKVSVGDECVPIEDAGSIAHLSDAKVFQLEGFAGGEDSIERIEAGEDTVRYTNIRLISPGKWTDSNSRETVWYSPDAMRNLEVVDGAPVHIFHDSGNDVSEVGAIDGDSVTNRSDGVYADITLSTDTPAGEFADQNMQKALETGGKDGFGGPSVEIPPDGQEIEHNQARGVKELKKGKIDALALVKQPAAKDVHFGNQAAQRGVALAAGSQEAKAVYLKDGDMSDKSDRARILEAIATRELAMDDIEDDAQNIADELDVPIGDVMEVLDPLMDMDEDNGGGEENLENESDNGEEDEEADEEDDEMDMADVDDAVEQMMDEIDEVWEEIDKMREEMVMEESLSAADPEDVDETKEELSAAKERVAELEDTKDELERRLSELEDEPTDPKTLADDNGDSDSVTGPVSSIQSRDTY